MLATFSMVFDIGWIMDNFNNASQADSAGSLAQSSRAARVTRIVRLVRLIRLVRIVKLYKQAKLAQQKREEAKLKKLREEKGKHHDDEEGEGQNNALSKRKKLQRQRTTMKDAEDVDIDEMQLESKISKTLAEKNQKILIILILTTLFLTPMFQVATFVQPIPAPEFGLDQLMGIYDNTYTTNATVYQDAYTAYVDYMRNYFYPIVELNVPVYNFTTYGDKKSDLRSDEFTVITSSNGSKATYSIKKSNQYEALINIGRTIMVCFLLTISSYIINRDATRLVLDPIERMIERIRIVAKNPMALCSEEEIEAGGALAMMQSNKKKKKKNDKKHEEEIKNESAFLEASLYTIGRLLGLCFGEAGARIIGNNIASSEIGSDFNPLIPGSKELAIFGFCDIRGFADATEALEEEVMQFVNQIAEIVHSEVDLHSGSSNKNLGEAFLMVWKFPRTDIDSFDDELSIRPDNRYCNNIADLAVLGFLKVNAKINKYRHILEYSKNEKMLERIPNYRVNMGFGLHVGWGIEGAIGSPYKIDASYLSPNVNISARLEAATRQYGVSILISGELQEILNEGFQEITRLIDIVTVKGSAIPMKFYTVNLKLDVLEVEKAPFEGMTPTQKKEIRGEAKKDLKTKINNEIVTTEDLLKEDPDIMKMMDEHKSNNTQFKDEYLAAFKKYIDGNWGDAISIFRK
jgi:class 3 adenylate cyclase